MPAGPDILPDPEPDPSGYDIDIARLDTRWDTDISDLDALCTRAARAADQAARAPQTGDLSVAFMDDAQIQALNAQYRGKDKPTNVLSFPPDGFNPVMGDIALAYETCALEAAQKDISLRDHAAHLIIHGYLHLSGYDHENDADASKMEALEITALKTLGIENPYEENNV